MNGNGRGRQNQQFGRVLKVNLGSSPNPYAHSQAALGAAQVAPGRRPTPYESGLLGMFDLDRPVPVYTNPPTAAQNHYHASFSGLFLTPEQGAITQRIPVQVTWANTNWF